MFQGLRRFLSIGGHPQPSNQVTPSQNRHINSLPTELLIAIFQNYCGFIYGPVSLSLVCRFWHSIITACPALWTSIIFDRSKRFSLVSGMNESPIWCRTWSDLERAITRTGTATLSLVFHVSAKLHPQDEEDRVLRLFGLCRYLHITLENVDGYTFASSIAMPHLQHLVLDIDKKIRIEPLLDSIERTSPLLRSLSISSFIPTNLERHQILLRQITHLELLFIRNNDMTFQGLQNLEELTIDSMPSIGTEFSPSDFPKLVSLHIADTPLLTYQEFVPFPVLESLTISGKQLDLRFISAPKLRNLVIISRYAKGSQEEIMSTLRPATVRPTSLSIDFISDAYLPELLGLWSNLSELDLRSTDHDCIPGLATTVALSGSGNAAPLCPSLRYLTVHMTLSRKDPKLTDRSIQRLKRIIMKRKGYGVVGLRRVMCVWDWRERNSDFGTSSTEVEWVDVI